MRPRATRTVAICAVLVACVAARSAAQTAPAERRPTWAFTVSAGDFALGNKSAVASWLRRNSYGVSDTRCVFNILLARECDPPTSYPQISGSAAIGWMIGLRRAVTDDVGIEAVAATEQSGTATGHCDDTAVPRDSRCTENLMTVDFGGASIAALAKAKVSFLELGAGPALMLANWRLSPSHLAGLWFDATYMPRPTPFFVRAQYRIYQSAGFAPARGFTALHPSSLLVGAGFSVRLEESGR